MLDNANHAKPPLPPNDRFGYLFAGISTIAAAYIAWTGANSWALLFVILALGFAGAARFAPHLLAPLNRIWLEFGLLLGKIVSPVVLGILFFAVLSPVAVVTRLFGRDPLSIRRRATASYWVERDPPGPASDSFRNQF